MRFSSVIQMGKSYLLLGILVVAVAAVIWFLIRTGAKKKTGAPLPPVNKGRLLVCACFLCYIVVVLGATLLDRGITEATNLGTYTGNLILHPFYSYREAWCSGLRVDWQNLILNICMFLPMGFLLPLVFKKWNRFWQVYLTGFCISVLIEAIQFWAGRGIAEFDDVFNNSLGCAIGYGLVSLCAMVNYAVRRVRRKGTGKKAVPDEKKDTGSVVDKEQKNVVDLWTTKKRTVLLLQVPLLASVVCFISIFSLYQHQEFGNLLQNYYYRVDMKQTAVSTQVSLAQSSEKKEVYALAVKSEEELAAYANELFRVHGTAVDPSQNDVYDNTVIFRSQDGNYNVWLEYKGMASDFTDFTKLDTTATNVNLSRDRVEALLQAYAITIPPEAVFQSEENGNYSFTVSMVQTEQGIIDGTLTCQINDAGELMGFRNRLLSYEAVRSVDCISEQEAYEKLCKGEFNIGYQKPESELVVTKVADSYRVDSKGYFQPVYEFYFAQREEPIMIPALP